MGCHFLPQGTFLTQVVAVCGVSLLQRLGGGVVTLVVVGELLIAVTFLVAEHRL